MSLSIHNQTYPHYTATALYDAIIPGDCYWVKSGHELQLHLIKRPGSPKRWTSLFGVDDGVDETLDPSQVVVFSERMMHRTADQEEHVRLGGGMEEEDVDASRIVLRVVGASGVVKSTTSAQEWLCACFPQPDTPPSVCVRRDVDGIVVAFAPENVQHVATLDAFGFVQASKRDKRLMGVDAGGAFAVISESRKRLYVYANPTRSAYGVQRVIELAGNEEIHGMQWLPGIGLCVLCEGRTHMVQL
jgi:hypothetical protein